MEHVHGIQALNSVIVGFPKRHASYFWPRINFMKSPLLFFVTAILFGCAPVKELNGQRPSADSDARRPKLIVGITVDQMRYDYIERFWNDYSKGGFRRLVGEGFFCRNLQYNYMPTYTAPGHASIFTGTTPAYHGIIENDWYERSSGLTIYCSSDSTVSGVGTASKAGQMSPHYLTSTTIGDELRLFTNKRSKVFGIAMKDRGAILPAGRTADAAYWFVGAEEGMWSTSTWYMNELPQWVQDFNAKGRPNALLSEAWTLLRDTSVYDESLPDNNAYETPYRGTLRPVFPYDLNAIRGTNGNFELIKATPAGNLLTAEFGKALIENEKLAKGQFTDMLCMSFSATDYIGHQFGMHSREVQDCYLRLDEVIADFLKYLDENIGKGNYLVFLSADHGGAPTPSYTINDMAAGGYWKSDNVELYVEEELVKKYGAGDWVINESNQNIFLNRELIEASAVDLKDVQNDVAMLVSSYPDVLMSFTSNDLSQFKGGNKIKQMVENGFNQAMSGDVVYVLKPGFIENSMTGTTHGSVYSYDTHVPGIFFGFGVEHGESYVPYKITDIAPTVTSICHLPFPNACTGEPIIEAMKK